MGMRGISVRTAENRANFLAVLADCGNVTAACAVCGMSRPSAYLWRRDVADFAAAWEEALVLGLAGLEDRAAELAMAGNDRLMMFLLTAGKPEKYSQRHQVDLNVSVNIRSQPLDVLRAELATMLAPPPLAIDHDDDPDSVVVGFPQPPDR